MRFLHLPFLYFVLSVFSPSPALEYPSSSSKTNLEPTATISDVELGAANTLLQSKDGGQTWQDISNGLPELEQPQGFFAGESDLYLRVKNVMYRSNNDLETPIWEKQDHLDSRSTSIAFNPSGVMAFNHGGKVYQKKPHAETWSPIYAKSKEQLDAIFESANGTVFLGCRSGLYKSVNKGQSWKQVLNQGWVMDIVESQGVLIGRGQKGIIRSADNGENWELVIDEGGVGIAVERIDGGFAAITYNTMYKSRRIRVSMDGGKNWKAIDQQLPPSSSISSIKQMGPYLICGHPDGIFRSADKGKTWSIVRASLNVSEFKFVSVLNGAPSDEGKKLFNIFASGKTLYAVLSNGGC